MTLALGWVHPGEVSGMFMESVLDVLYEDHKRKSPRVLDSGGTIAVMSGPRIAAARNRLVETFIKGGCDWLLMADTDMVFKASDLELLFDVADPKLAPIVGGLCFAGGFDEPVKATLYSFNQPESGLKIVEPIVDYPKDGICEVDATGAAFLLMHRDALIAIGKQNEGHSPWFTEGMQLGNAGVGEDIAFCVRARQLGIPIYVHTGAKIGHIKPCILTEEMYDGQQVREKVLV